MSNTDKSQPQAPSKIIQPTDTSLPGGEEEVIVQKTDQTQQQGRERGFQEGLADNSNTDNKEAEDQK